MLILKLAFRTLMRRKGRMILIGVLVAFGTFLIVFGGIFAVSAEKASRDSIIGNFTGDFIVYAARAKDLPSPFAFNTPLPSIQNPEAVAEAVRSIEAVEVYAFYTQNYGIIQVERGGTKLDLPFIFYAVEPAPYRSVFANVSVEDGSFFGLSESSGSGTPSPGILISAYQNSQYQENYGVSLDVGEAVTLLGITEGGVNTVRSSLVGIFEPAHYKNVFDYINFVDADTYASLYNFTGVESLPSEFNEKLAAADDEMSIFDLADDESFGKIDVESLTTQTVTGFTMLAVKLKDHERLDEVMTELGARSDLGIKIARWDAASGFYAQISKGLQAFIYIATALIFLVVTMIFMNTLIINVVERTAEVGTMRALGAEKSFVASVFLAETLMLNVSAALISMALSALLLLLFSEGGVPLPETVSQFLIGGGSLKLQAGFAPFGLAFLIVIAVSVLATLYPVAVASSITPLKAMSDR